MISYERIPSDVLNQMAREKRKVHAAIANLANKKMGLLTAEPRGIHRAEGGVKINGYDIKIKRDYVICNSAEETDEERCVVEAIKELVYIYKKGDGRKIDEIAQGFDGMVIGDGLPDFFGMLWNNGVDNA